MLFIRRWVSMSDGQLLQLDTDCSAWLYRLADPTRKLRTRILINLRGQHRVPAERFDPNRIMCILYRTEWLVVFVEFELDHMGSNETLGKCIPDMTRLIMGSYSQPSKECVSPTSSGTDFNKEYCLPLRSCYLLKINSQPSTILIRKLRLQGQSRIINRGIKTFSCW